MTNCREGKMKKNSFGEGGVKFHFPPKIKNNLFWRKKIILGGKFVATKRGAAIFSGPTAADWLNPALPIGGQGIDREANAV